MLYSTFPFARQPPDGIEREATNINLALGNKHISAMTLPCLVVSGWRPDCAFYLNVPAVKPATKYRPRKIKMSSGGMEVIIAPAIWMCHSWA